MKRGLFILHEGIGNSIFTTQVLEHVKYMKKHSIEIDILTFETLKKQRHITLNNYNRIKKDSPEITIFLKKGINQFFIFGGIYNLIVLYFFLFKNRKKYSFIHSRADYTTFLNILIKKFIKLPIIWDCRGDSLDELRLSLKDKSPIVKLYGLLYLIPYQKFQISQICKHSDKGIFVSKELFKLYERKIRFSALSIIPCLVNENKFYFNPEIRNRKRTELGLIPTNNVFIYSGSMVGYQALEMQKQFFKEILSDNNNILVYLTTDPRKAKDFFNNFPKENFIITSAKFDEMNDYYNAADFAVLLRDKLNLNWVASPTKFGEYCLSGLTVIMNDTIAQAYEFSHLLNNYTSSQSDIFNKKNENERFLISNKSKELFSRNYLYTNYLYLYE